jgi:poly(glycerol-phosphate) alpha-glucosyltransferase
MGIRFPEADYFIASSRLRPGLDGGYTVATLRRAQQFAEYAGVNPVLLTFDFWPDYDEVVAEFSRIGLMDEQTVVRNLLQDARESPSFLRASATTDGAGQPELPGTLAGEADVDAQGRPWRIISTDADTGAIFHTDFLDLDGRPMLRVPYVTGRADWHQAPIRITVFAEDGSVHGWLDGFGDLYRAWMQYVLGGTSPSRPNVVVCESRQVGELLVELSGDDLRLVHTVHSAHTSAPYQWDSPIDGLWASWLAEIDRFDAVVWLTERQRQAVERRFGVRDNFWVVPHAVDLVLPASPVPRDPNLIVMIGRLAALKRLDHALAALEKVARDHPDARIVFYGDGPDEHRLRQLAETSGLGGAVEFRGHQPDAAESLAEAAVMLFTSTYEGQGLVVLEAFARGCPVVAYDINYGPSEMVVNGENGLLVPDGDIDALADALGSVLGDADRVAALSAAARASAERHTPESSIQRMADLFAAVVERPRRRSGSPLYRA